MISYLIIWWLLGFIPLIRMFILDGKITIGNFLLCLMIGIFGGFIFIVFIWFLWIETNPLDIVIWENKVK